MAEPRSAGSLQVGFAGLSHLGMNYLAASAERGFRVTGYDPQPARRACLQQGRSGLVEPGLDEMLERNAERVQVVETANGLHACDIVFISQDVATDDQGISDLTQVWQLIEEVLAGLSPDALLVVLCQVEPGFTRALAQRHPRVAYQVETLVFGQAVERALRPERLIVGVPDAAAELPADYSTYLAAFDCPVLPMRYESAELCKIAINCCLVASVTVANTLAELCERIRADWMEIVPALQMDRRIGPHAYLKPGLGIAGGNLERDLATVVRLGAEHGSDTRAIRASQDNSRYRRDWVLRTLHRELLAGRDAPRIAMLGLSYKENTASIKNSPAIHLLEALRGCSVQAYDPVVELPAGEFQHVAQCTGIEAACRGAQALLIMTPWEEFRGLQPEQLAGWLSGNLLIDPFRCLQHAQSAHLRIFQLGVDARSESE